MKITRDNNNNVSYTLETNDIYAQQIIDYWTPEKKAKDFRREFYKHLCVLSDVLIESQKQVERGSLVSFQEMAKTILTAPTLWSVAIC